MVAIYNKIRNCSGVGFHGWYNSSIGIIRKPNGSVRSFNDKIEVKQKTTTPEIKVSWFRKILNWLKVVVGKIINLAR